MAQHKAMYQLEVKSLLIATMFPPGRGWRVSVDVDAMERCNGGVHPPGKRDRVLAAEARLKELGVQIGKHEEFGCADVVAIHPTRGTVVVEVEGTSSRQCEQAMYSALGQTVLMMREGADHLSYALAVPDEVEWGRQLVKIPSHVLTALRLRLLLVSETGVRELGDNGPDVGTGR